MKFITFIRYICLTIISSWLLFSCDSVFEQMQECRLYVQFKYDYNMLSTDAFHTKVDKVELYVFDEDGKFMFKQSEEGTSLASGSYRMEVKVPVGRYKFMAWAGVHNSYSVPSLVAGTSTITDLKLKLKRDSSLIIDNEVDPLWYGEIIDVDFTGNTSKTEIINLIKDTNKVRFVFQGYTEGWEIDVNDYTYEIIESNGYLDYDNSLLKDDVLSYRPYYKEQKNEAGALVEMNTMRLMADRQTRFVVTEKSTGKKVFNINLIDYLSMTEMEGHGWGTQEYFDRQDEYVIVFFFSGEKDPSDSWLAIQMTINGWTYYFQTEEGT